MGYQMWGLSKDRQSRSLPRGLSPDGAGVQPRKSEARERSEVLVK